MRKLGVVDLTGQTVTSNSGRSEREWGLAFNSLKAYEIADEYRKQNKQ